VDQGGTEDNMMRVSYFLSFLFLLETVKVKGGGDSQIKQRESVEDYPNGKIFFKFEFLLLGFVTDPHIIYLVVR